MGNGYHIPGVKRPVLETDHPHLLPRLRMSGVLFPLPPKGIPAWRTQGQHNFHAMNRNLGGPQSSYLLTHSMVQSPS